MKVDVNIQDAITVVIARIEDACTIALCQSIRATNEGRTDDAEILASVERDLSMQCTALKRIMLDDLAAPG